jgi:hypothetical protein
MPRHPKVTVAAPRQPRLCRQGAHGRDVVAYKGGLVHAGVRPRRLRDSPTFGHTMRSEVAHFQRLHGLRSDGVIGPHTYEHLIRWVGDYGRRLIRSMVMDAQLRNGRSRMQQNALWIVSVAWEMHYAEIRPIPISTPYRHAFRSDCSGTCDILARWSGLPSPMGSYNGVGNTDTMDAHCRRVGEPAIGDYVRYGFDGLPQHVAIYVGGQTVVSHGSESGPFHTSMFYRRPLHYLSCLEVS